MIIVWINEHRYTENINIFWLRVIFQARFNMREKRTTGLDEHILNFSSVSSRLSCLPPSTLPPFLLHLHDYFVFLQQQNSKIYKWKSFLSPKWLVVQQMRFWEFSRLQMQGWTLELCLLIFSFKLSDFSNHSCKSYI